MFSRRMAARTYKFPWRNIASVLLCVFAGIGGTSSPVSAGPLRAVIVGVRRYPTDERTPSLRYPHLDAQSVEKYLRSGAAGQVDSRKLAVLIDEKATRDRVDVALRRALLEAGFDD